MPVRCPVDPDLPQVLDRQHQLISRDQALAAGLTPRAIAFRLAAGHWQLVLPDVYLTHRGRLDREHRLRAALLFAGDDAAIDAVDACAWYGVKAATIDERRVHVVVPSAAPARSYDFVVVRRCKHALKVVTADNGIRYVDAPAAVIAAARGLRFEREVTALLSDAVQRGVVTPGELHRAHVVGPPRGSRLTALALEHVLGGARSLPEAGFRVLASRSRVLPPLLYNPLLRLPDGRLISPDALDVEAGLVHETNGRSAHARTDLFEDMQARHDVMTAAGLIVLHNSPRRIAMAGHAVLKEFELCHLRYAGRGLPQGIEIVRASAS